MQDLLLFSHANGFPAPVYRVMLEALAGHFRVVRPERIGHDPRYPVTRDWPHLVDELCARIDGLDLAGRRLWLVGHSLGGYLSMMAASRLARRVAGVVMIDSPLIAGWRAQLVRLGRCTGLDSLVMPIRATLQRRRHWPDRAAVHAHFAAKPAFARWDPRVLHDYVEHGTRDDGDGARELVFQREVEHRIYRTLPMASNAVLARGLQVPVGFLAGTRSRELRHAGLDATRGLVGPHLSWVEGSHLFPMERPEETAQAVHGMIGRLDVVRGRLHEDAPRRHATG
ncbi:alpha/beta fold hydrolase [Montanilutibacter psychrotolerans]|uniref:Alpha/beta hydrolase n=1 Tax=Montanilutibacter psychrotolerans TaxID=1327343 RepID=A0A3M8T0Y4_9GAMM|nr:alpha/beta hydrolase [Lysobacter psychrotolerans]RNF85326.1 alpha/beta hydrolase [Lysobacter psychrotolerans]